MEVTEIFQSIDGEVNLWGQGRLSTFIRLSGCNLSCKWCDTPQSKVPGKGMEVEEIFRKVRSLGCPKITITGGEPLVQYEEVLRLIDLLLVRGFGNSFDVSVETNGTIFPPLTYLQDKHLSWVFDYKLEYPEKMQLQGMQNILSPIHWIKVVVDGEESYKQAVCVKDQFREAGCRASFAFSPVFHDSMAIDPDELVSWLIRDGQWDVWLNVQIHKLISVR